MNELVTCTALSKRYGSLTALDHIDLHIAPGRIIGLLGPNGSGKTTLIKILTGLLRPTEGSATVNGLPIGHESKALVSYLPERMYYANWMRTSDMLQLFADFYADFHIDRAKAMCNALGIGLKTRVKSMSKGTKEKLQLILVMSRQAKLYLLDEPIAGVDPAARDFILQTILTNYSKDSSVILSTHLITDIEPVLDEVIFLGNGRVLRHESVDAIREAEGRSVDAVFREIFRTIPVGGDWPC
ncbi:MAG: ABC transporter ATP-binding protein [Oscillospiraceae bacterium]|jgi:ABC-2 type transport system ATP-binding protein|nr:ABC transporter ATP-binding protein [Oscillospiraceae bacterium]